VNKLSLLILLLLFTNNCSLDKKTGLWTNDKNLKEEKENQKQKLFKTEAINTMNLILI